MAIPSKTGKATPPAAQFAPTGNELIDRMLDRYKAANHNAKRHTAHSRKWFAEYIRKNVRRSDDKALRTSKIVQGGDKASHVKYLDKPMIGDMLFYDYDPKWKDELPYYDKFPMIFIFDADPKGFMGINLHYLPPAIRLKLFTELLKVRSDTRYRQSVRLKIAWNILKAFSNIGLVQPCVKRYLWTHVRSRFIKVQPQYWELVLTLPLERFKKASNKQVWADSLGKGRKKK